MYFSERWNIHIIRLFLSPVSKFEEDAPLNRKGAALARLLESRRHKRKRRHLSESSWEGLSGTLPGFNAAKELGRKKRAKMLMLCAVCRATGSPR